jgi:hypothetical protein
MLEKGSSQSDKTEVLGGADCFACESKGGFIF